MKRALVLLVAALLAGPALGQTGRAAMDVTRETVNVDGSSFSYSALPLPAGCTTGSMAIFLGSLTCVPGLTFTSSTLTIPVGTGTATAKVGGTLFVTTTQRATTGTTIEVLATYPMPAGTLSSNGASIVLRAAGTHAANTNAAIIHLRFGGTQVSARSSSVSGANYYIDATITRLSATTVWCYGFIFSGTASSPFSTSVTADLNALVNIEIAGTTATAAGDLTFEAMLVEAR